MSEPKKIPHVAERVLRVKDVLTRIAVGRTKFHEMRRDGQFPPPVRLGARAIGWTESSIDGWIANLPKLDK